MGSTIYGEVLRIVKPRFHLRCGCQTEGSKCVHEGKALLTRYSAVETANWDYRTLDMVAQVVRLDIEGRLLDVYVTHHYWAWFDRCIDYIWVAGPLVVPASGVCFNTPSATDSTLWPSDHAGVWADQSFV